MVDRFNVFSAKVLLAAKQSRSSKAHEDVINQKAGVGRGGGGGGGGGSVTHPCLSRDGVGKRGKVPRSASGSPAARLPAPQPNICCEQEAFEG